jgi:HK97 gp10 family phage protein
MAGETVVLGRARLNRKLRALPEAAKAEIRKAMEKGANEIVELAKNLVPHDSGASEDSIGWTWGAAPKGTRILGTARAPGGLTLTIFAGSSEAYYVRFIEFGTSGGAFGPQPPRPFFFSSYVALRKRVVARIRRGTNKAAKKVAAMR